MRKIACSFLAFLCAVNISASADVNVTVSDSSNNIIAVSGDAPQNSDVMIYILNDGCSKEDIALGKEDVLIYASHTVADQNGYRFEFDMSGYNGDAFEAVVAHSGTNESFTFSFYPENFKLVFIQSLAQKTVSSDDVVKAAKVFGVDSTVGFTGKCYESAADTLEQIRISAGFAKDSNGEYDIAAFSEVLQKTLVFAALCTHCDGIFASDGKLRYADVLGISELSEYKDYNSVLSPNGIKAAKSFLEAQSIDDAQTFEELFCETVYVNVLINYNMMGYGHVKDYIRKYETAYQNAGFDIDGFDALSDAKQKSVCKNVSTADADSLKDLARIFNRAVSDAKSEKQSSGSGGGGSPSSGTNIAPGYVAPELEAQPDAPQDKTEFADVDKNHWAYEYISLLAGKKVINGYGDGNFVPQAGVTRAEFTKMAVLMMGLEADGDVSVFEDASGLWCTPYVNAAAKAGIIKGMSDTLFAPDMTVSREQAATIVARAAGIAEAEATDLFDDDELVSDYASGYVYALKAMGKISGRGDNRFEPGAPITRAEAAKLLVTVFEISQ